VSQRDLEIQASEVPGGPKYKHETPASESAVCEHSLAGASRLYVCTPTLLEHVDLVVCLAKAAGFE
jgi:hypothetical protein